MLTTPCAPKEATVASEMMWLVMRLMKNGGTNIGLDISMEDSEMAGFVPVFKRYEDAEEYAKGAKIYCIQAEAMRSERGGGR